MTSLENHSTTAFPKIELMPVMYSRSFTDTYYTNFILMIKLLIENIKRVLALNYVNGSIQFD